MDGGESSAPKLRKRTESIGGSSDSELSEGWNIIDQTDVTNHDVTSSDGESVEVIDAEDESRENEVERESSLATVTDTPVVAHTEPEVPSLPEETPQEEMFDSSFRWFLIYATAAVLFSNIAFLVADYALVWNADQEIDAPSFLRDLPTTPKLVNENKLIQDIPWDVEEEEAIVEILDDGPSMQHTYGKSGKRSQNIRIDKNHPHKLTGERISKYKDMRFNKNLKESYKKQHFEKLENINENGNSVANTDKFDFSNQNFGDHKIGKYITALNEVTTSLATKDKFNQVFLILDALYIGLNELELVVTDKSELKNVLKTQKHQLSQILTEMEYGVSKSLDRLATSVLNKVSKLERRFEHQWCNLEKRGYQDVLNGLFYDCQENEKKAQSQGHKSSDHFEVKRATNQPPRIDMNLDSDQYQVDKDSPGKEHGNAHGNEANELDDYLMMLKNEMKNNKDFTKDQQNLHQISNPEHYIPANELDKIKLNHMKKENFDNNSRKTEQFYENVKFGKEKKHDDTKENQFNYGNRNLNDDKNYDNQRQNIDRKKNNDDKGKYKDGRKKYYNDGGKHYDDKRGYNNEKKIYVDDKGKFSDSYNKYEEKKSQDKIKHDKRSKDIRHHTKKFETYGYAEQNRNHDQSKGKEGYTKSDRSIFDVEPIPEVIEKYFKETCEKGKDKFKNMYEKLKSLITSKLKVPKNIFDLWYAKYCRVNDESFKWEKRFNREHPKGDFSGKNKKYFKDEQVIGNFDKNVRIVEVPEVGSEDEVGDPDSENIIPDIQPRQWVFHYDEPNDNQSNLTGDWFFRSGEARSKIRWNNQRGDWWFERASHRRTQPRSTWFSGRRKNWYFRRAWARQNCRHNPHDEWCDFSEEEKVTVPNPNVNLR